MSIKQLYGYFFYTFYRVWLKIDKAFRATGPFPTDVKALICKFAVEVWLGFAIAGYISYFFNIHLHIAKFFALMPFVILLAINWFIFETDDKWRKYVNEFDKWPKEKNIKGAWIVSAIIFIILLSFIYAVRLHNPSMKVKW